jgi:PKD repeat protein
MVPNQNGTPLSFANGDVETVTLNFNLDPSWPLADVEFVAGIQAENKEFLQGIKRAAIDLNVDFTANTTQVGANGTVSFTNNTTGGYIGTPETYEWSFPGGTPATSTLQNPTVTYTECGTHDVTLTVNRGGQVKTVTRQAYIQVGPLVNITSSPSDTSYWPFNPITLDATVDDPNATYLWQPGGETTPTITVTESQYGLGEHTFTVTVNSMGCTIEKSHKVYFWGTVGKEDLRTAGIQIIPNPSHGQIEVYMSASGNYDLTILDLSGRVVLSLPGISTDAQGKITAAIEKLVPGSYLVKVSGKESVFSQKLIVK